MVVLPQMGDSVAAFTTPLPVPSLGELVVRLVVQAGWVV